MRFPLIKLLKWVKKHVRPHFKYNPKKGEGIDVYNDSVKEVMDKLEDQSEVGIKFTFKF